MYFKSSFAIGALLSIVAPAMALPTPGVATPDTALEPRRLSRQCGGEGFRGDPVCSIGWVCTNHGDGRWFRYCAPRKFPQPIYYPPPPSFRLPASAPPPPPAPKPYPGYIVGSWGPNGAINYKRDVETWAEIEAERKAAEKWADEEMARRVSSASGAKGQV